MGNSSEELLGLVFPAAGATSDDLISISCIAGQAGSSGGTGQCVKALRREIRDVRLSLGTLWPVAPYERYKVVSSGISRYLPREDQTGAVTAKGRYVPLSYLVRQEETWVEVDDCPLAEGHLPEMLATL
ncbi:hypothetical protein CGCF415_v004419 [Colletotrichum fructicola]|nr:hypothetical protein CGCFRS4_v002970 [Colletotrichum fructicola]KAF4911511.1 hypothetical protein CGCF415_v004419 [Colletotrichum fructicola]KAF4939230.1 hypothetical protein CGCF245_v003814 [Colletotrichum fructicola]